MKLRCRLNWPEPASWPGWQRRECWDCDIVGWREELGPNIMRGGERGPG